MGGFILPTTGWPGGHDDGHQSLPPWRIPALLMVAGAAAATVHAPAPGPPIPKGPSLLFGRVLDRNVLTNPDGYFVFRDMPAGRYSIATRAFGYLNHAPIRRRPSPVRVGSCSQNERVGLSYSGLGIQAAARA